MNRKHFVTYFFIALLMGLASFLMTQVPSNNDQYAPNLIAMDNNYRVLVPILAQWFMALTGLPATWSLAVVMFASGIASFWALRKFMDYQFIHDESYVYASWCVIYFMLWNYMTALDFMTVFLFCLSFYYLDSYQYGKFFALFPLVTIHRETSALLIVFYLLWIMPNLKNKTAEKLLGLNYLIFIYIALRLLLMYMLPGNAQPFAWLKYDVTGTYLSNPWMLFVVIAFGMFLWRILIDWFSTFRFLRIGFLLFLVQVVLHLLLGNPYEIRVLIEFIPFVMILFYRSVLPFIISRNFLKSTGSKSLSPD